MTEQSCREDPRVVDDQQVARADQVRQRSHAGMRQRSLRTIDRKQSGRRSVGRRRLGDQIERKIKIEFADIHREGC